MCVSPQHFTEQLEALCQLGQPISLRELASGLQDGDVPKRAVVLTVDDGYADTLYHAKPLLERYQMPATVFVATGYLGREFWWDELVWILSSPTALLQRLSLKVDSDVYQWEQNDTTPIRWEEGRLGPRQQLLQSLYRRLLRLSSLERERVMAELRAWAGVESDNGPLPRALAADELTQLATEGLVDIGAHTVTHPLLAELPVAAQQLEIQRSKADLEDLLARPVISFSYPNGSWLEETQTLVWDSGFACACASYSDVVWRSHDPFCLPRFWIPDCDGKIFSRWLQRWLSG
jgi:peptidoglycan/xylan/chitin deacetylase (PgdA/CDA1 family)